MNTTLDTPLRTNPESIDSPVGPLVSVITPTHNIGAGIERAWQSLLAQTYRNWEWVVVDDSTDPATADHVAGLADRAETAGRLRLFRQYPPPGSVGASKAAACALCRGEIIVELDHDDEFLPMALELVAAAFVAHPEIDFVSSDWLDWIDPPEGSDATGYPGRFPDGWGFGLGGYASEMVGGRRVPVALTPPITWETIRHIVATPNHLRAWRTTSYRRIGGHDHRLPVADDYDLMVRTFLDGTMAHIPRPLYIQHHSPAESNTSRRRNGEIQERVAEIAAVHREALDWRCLSRGVTPSTSPPWSWRPTVSATVRVDPMADRAADTGDPLVTVVIPTHNRPDLLHRAIESALGQSFRNIEVLVVGDACPAVDAVVDGIPDERLRHGNLIERASDLGATPRNYALKAMARGTLIAYLDDDNWWEPDHLASLVAEFRRDPTIAFAFSSFTVAGQTIECRRPRRFQIDTSALLHRRLLVERFGYWRTPDEADYAHDWELVSRWDGEPWAATLRPTLHYTLETSHQNAMSVQTMLAIADEEREGALLSGAGQ